ncbi:MAG: 5-formyltetrahydrofolate cyclo-ligase [Alistipes sp.]|nr:5-formyltetrahydrofolate cyclo-ligase [Alistipes sp.]
MLPPIKAKSELRRAAKEAVKSLSAEQRQSSSALIIKKILALDIIKSARTVALYASLPDEVATAEALEALSTQKLVLLPRVEGDDMEFYPYNAATLERGAYGISEPQEGCAVMAEQIDVIIVPGVVFTLTGKRIGRGKGYYDKYLSRKGFRATKVGVCYGVQIAEDIDTEPHDIVMDYVICD